MGMAWVKEHHGNTAIRDQVFQWMVHVCLQQFRVDVLRATEFEMLVDQRNEALLGLRPFWFGYLESIMADRVHLVSGNRCRFQKRNDLVDFLFDYDDGLVRTSWENVGFRKLYQRAHKGLGKAGGKEFGRQAKQMLCDYHWVLPYPHSGGLTRKAKPGPGRMWYSIVRDVYEGGWKWGGKSIEEGQPQERSEYMSWSKTEWEGWIGRMVRYREVEIDMERSGERMEVMIVIDGQRDDGRREFGLGGLGSVNTILENGVGRRSNRLSRHHKHR
jgi:hypothetical protein